MSRGNQKQPIDLIMAKGKKHLTKQEIEDRKNSEVKVNFTDVTPPDYLDDEQKQEFLRISNILLTVGIMTELDEDCLAHYLIANTNYILYTKKIRELNKKILDAKRADAKRKAESEIDTYLIYQDRALKQCRACANDLGITSLHLEEIDKPKSFAQCRACANDLGLSISSRCKLVMPPTKEEPKQNKFAKFKVVGQ